MQRLKHATPLARRIAYVYPLPMHNYEEMMWPSLVMTINLLLRLALTCKLHSHISLVASTLTCLVLNRLDNLMTVLSCIEKKTLPLSDVPAIAATDATALQVHFSIRFPESQVQCPSPLSKDFSSNVMS